MNTITTIATAFTTAEWIFLVTFGAAPAAAAALWALADRILRRPRQLVADNEHEAGLRRARR